MLKAKERQDPEVSALDGWTKALMLCIRGETNGKQLMEEKMCSFWQVQFEILWRHSKEGTQQAFHGMPVKPKREYPPIKG
jgi:hypothetical protein